MRVSARQDLIGGVCVAAVGLAAAVNSLLAYNIGTPGRMGPGFFPLCLGLCMLGFGLLIAIFGARSERVELTIDARAFIAVLASIAVFALILPAFGLLPASVLLVLVSLLASSWRGAIPALLTAAGVAVTAILVFKVGLKVPLPLLRWPL